MDDAVQLGYQAANGTLLQAIIRLDAGFGTWENIALLIELSYEVYTSRSNIRMANPTKYGVTADMAWTAVGSDVGIKEGKAVFQMHHLKFRSAPVLWRQEQFAALAARVLGQNAGWTLIVASGQMTGLPRSPPIYPLSSIGSLLFVNVHRGESLCRIRHSVWPLGRPVIFTTFQNLQF